jgi:hypothetical protein
MTDDADDLKKQLEAHKPKKKKLTVPEGFHWDCLIVLVETLL